jgi:hypothetical protein
MDNSGIHHNILNKVGNGSAFWKSSFRAGEAAAWEVMAMLCIMRRPQGLLKTIIK